jgi:hypothetical protein
MITASASPEDCRGRPRFDQKNYALEMLSVSECNVFLNEYSSVARLLCLTGWFGNN